MTKRKKRQPERHALPSREEVDEIDVAEIPREVDPDALRAFMKVDPKKVEEAARAGRKGKKKRAKE